MLPDGLGGRNLLKCKVRIRSPQPAGGINQVLALSKRRLCSSTSVDSGKSRITDFKPTWSAMSQTADIEAVCGSLRKTKLARTKAGEASGNH